MKKALILLLILSVIPISFAGQAKAVYNVNVIASPNTAGSTASYTITFMMSNALTAGGSIIITFPAGFTVPSGSLNPSHFQVIGVNPTSVNGAGQVLTIFPSQAGGLAAGYVYLSISSSAGFINPSSGGSYQFSVATSTAGEPVGYFSLTIASAVQNVTATVNPLNAGSVAEYWIQFKPNIALAANVDLIYIDFPSGTSIPSTFPNNVILVDGTGVPSANLSRPTQNRLQIKTPINLNTTSVHGVYVPSAVGIANTATPGTYTIKVSTNKETTQVDSNPFTLTGSAISTLSVSVSPNSAATNASYSIQFYTSSSGALSSSASDFIKIEFPSGTTVPSTGSAGAITINGVPCTTRSVSGTILTAYLPSGLNINNNAYVIVSISASYGIVNPATPNTYQMKVNTSKDIIPVSTSYSITGTSISNLDIVADPLTQNSNAQYTFTFRTSASGALASGTGKIYIQFPTEFNVPSSIAGSHVTVNGTACTSTITVSSDKLTITTPVNIGNSANVTVVIAKSAGIYNPTSASTYTLKVSTSADVVEVTDTLAIVVSTITKPSVTLTSYAISEQVGITVTFQTGSGGALTANSDKISIVFPAGFSIPSSISSTLVKVNNINASNVSKSGQRIDITPSTNIAARASVTVVIDKSANIKNPSSQGDYKISVYTSKETTQVESETFKIVILPTTTATVVPANPDGKNGYYRTRPRVTLSATSPVDTNPQIYYKFDTETAKLYTGPFDVPDGVKTLYYYAVDKYQNTEPQKTLAFKVDTVPPTITVTSPANNSVLSTKTFNITGRTEAGATLTINGVSVSLQPDGSFVHTATISGATSFTLIAEDVAGNTATFVLSVSLDTTPPTLTVNEPKAFTDIHTQFVTVKGVTEKGAKVKVNGVEVDVDPNTGAFQYVVTLVNAGLNSIEVTSEDIAGNVTTARIPVNFIPKTKIILQVGNTSAIVNDKTTKLDTAPRIVNGRTLVPIRFIAEAFGATVNWDPVFKLVVITLDKNQIYLQIGTNYASVNGKKVSLEAAPMISGGYTLVPIRFISESLGADVQWEPNTKTITIVYPK